MKNQLIWQERYNVGVDIIDKEHKKLFGIMNRLFSMNEKESKSQWVCQEGIKYFKTYAIEHFTDEETYMKSIDYEGYEIHKRLHDGMRYKTLPALEKDLLESDYSQESIQHFLGICLGWLTVHIMIEDRAITGKFSAKWIHGKEGKDVEDLEDALSDTIQEIFKRQVEIVSEHYSGENFGNSIISRLAYQPIEGKQIQIFLVLEESLALQAVSSMLDMPLKRVDKLVINTVKELSAQIVNRLGMYLKPPLQYQLESSHIMTMEQFRKEFFTESFYYSLLFNTGVGYFAFCIHLG